MAGQTHWDVKHLIGLLAAEKEGFSSWKRGDFIFTWKLDDHQLRVLVLTSLLLQALHREKKDCRGLLAPDCPGNITVSIFRDKSTRTRFSFASASSFLGFNVVDLDETKSQISHGETTRETAAMISFATSVVGIRDDLFLNSHEYHQQIIDSIEESYRSHVLHQRTTIVNLQCDLDHPTQSVSDLCHILTEMGDDGSLKAMKGKKIAVTWAHSPAYGKPRSVPQALITLLTRFGAHVTLAHPVGYDLDSTCLETAAKFAAASGGSFNVVGSMKEAYVDADVVYSKSWAPLTILQARTDALIKGVATDAALQKLEKECKEKNHDFVDWECTEELMKLTRNGPNTMYMHCLPADITSVNCDSGEVAASVFDRHRLATYREASFKPFVISAAMLLGQSSDAYSALNHVAK